MPNALGDSENYVPANPMQTPPAMNTNIPCTGFACIFPLRKSYSYKGIFEDEFNLNKQNSENNLLLNNKESINQAEKGFITIKNKKREIKKLELINLIESTKENIVKNNSPYLINNAKFLNDFKELANGVFQAEGHIGGYFPSISTITFRPLVYISQNASDSSIEFLVVLWIILDKNFKFIIYINQSSKYFHIRLLSRDWEFIIKKVIPYLSLVYGDKFKGLLKLKEIYHLDKNPNQLYTTKVKVINLAYSLVNNPGKKVSIYDKTYAVLSETVTTNNLNNIKLYPDNNKPLSILFLLGFLLGDGNFAIKIRDSKQGVWFIPIIRLEQKHTLDNSKLFNNIIEYLNKLDIKATIYKYEKNKHSSHIVIIENKVSIRNFINIIKHNKDFFFWKKEQINLIINSLVIISVAARHWKQSQIALLRLLYNKTDNNFKYNFDYWAKRLDDLYLERKKPLNDFYITMSKNRAWAVTLPVALNIKPKTKYFFFKTYNNSQKEAFNAAFYYRDFQLKNWLIDKGF